MKGKVKIEPPIRVKPDSDTGPPAPDPVKEDPGLGSSSQGPSSPRPDAEAAASCAMDVDGGLEEDPVVREIAVFCNPAPLDVDTYSSGQDAVKKQDELNCNEYFAHVQNLKKILVEVAPPEVCFSQSETISSQSEEIKLLNKVDSHQVNWNEYFAHVKNLKKILVEIAPPEVCFSQSETISSQSGEIKLLKMEDLHQDDCNKFLAHVQSLAILTTKVAALEEACSSQSEEIKLLRQLLAFSNEKLKVGPGSILRGPLINATTDEML